MPLPELLPLPPKLPNWPPVEVDVLLAVVEELVDVILTRVGSFAPQVYCVLYEIMLSIPK